jgi:hypothetical protein
MDSVINGISMIAVVLGVTEVIKKVFKLSEELSKRITPAIALVLGVVAGNIYVAPTDWRQGTLMGIMIGLSAVGLYSGSKNTLGN